MRTRTPDSPDQLARLWALTPAPAERAPRKRRITPEVEREVAAWVRWEVDRRALRDAEEEGAE